MKTAALEFYKFAIFAHTVEAVFPREIVILPSGESHAVVVTTTGGREYEGDPVTEEAADYVVWEFVLRVEAALAQEQ